MSDTGFQLPQSLGDGQPQSFVDFFPETEAESFLSLVPADYQQAAPGAFRAGLFGAIGPSAEETSPPPPREPVGAQAEGLEQALADDIVEQNARREDEEGPSLPFTEALDEETADGGEDRELLDEVHALRKEALEMRAEANDILEKSRQAAADIEAETEKRVEEMLDSAKGHADQIEADAYQAGFAQGEEAGRRLGDQKIESVARRLRSIVEEMSVQRDKLLAENECELVEVALLIAMELIHRELKQDVSVVLDVARVAVARLKQTGQLSVFVSPHDYAFIKSHVEDLQASNDKKAKIEIEQDASIARGGCRVTSNSGEVDATIDSMIGVLMEKIRGESPASEEEKEAEEC